MKELFEIQSKLKAPKSNYNKFGNYKFRSSEDILEAVKPLLEETKTVLNFNTEYLEIGEKLFFRVNVYLYSIDGKEIAKAHGLAEYSVQKGMTPAQGTGATESYAKKYALGNLFAIDDTKDSDSTNTHDKKQNKANEQPEKDWLNKNTENYNNVVKALKSGKFKIQDIQKKYKLSKEIKSELEKIKVDENGTNNRSN